MPAKKKTAKKTAKKSTAKKTAKKATKKTAKKAAPKKSSPVKKAIPKKPTPEKFPGALDEPVEEHFQDEHHDEYMEGMAECEHCLGAGKCTAGEPYDKGHHQVFGAKLILTSCADCLEAVGEHRNSKKLVECRVCGGRGRV